MAKASNEKTKLKLASSYHSKYTSYQEKIRHLEEQNHELNNFAHILSHDLRAPLRNINNLVTMILIDKSTELSPTAKSRLERIRVQATIAHNLVRDLREISLQSINNLQKENTSLETIWKQVCENYRETITKEDIAIETTTLPIIHANPQLIWQVFDNLIRNALIHGGRPLVIKITVEEHKAVHLIGFENSIAKSEIDNPKSTGLGLMICRKIIEMHGGELTLDHSDHFYKISFTLGKK